MAPPAQYQPGADRAGADAEPPITTTPIPEISAREPALRAVTAADIGLGHERIALGDYRKVVTVTTGQLQSESAEAVRVLAQQLVDRVANRTEA